MLYTIDQASLCNAVMVLEALDRLGSKADKVLMYPSEWDSVVTDRLDRDSQLLNMAHSFGAKLLAVRVPGVIRDGGDEQAVRGNFYTSWQMSEAM